MKKIVAFIAVLIYMTCAGTVWGQTDVTSQYVKNAGFDDGTNNWSGSPTVNSSCAEIYNQEQFDVYQELSGLNKGYYKLSAQAFYRDGWIDNEEDDVHVVNSFLYAGNIYVPVASIYSEADEKLTGDGFSSLNSGNSIPNTQGSAATAFAHNDKALYNVETSWVYVGDEKTLRIGIKKDAKKCNTKTEW